MVSKMGKIWVLGLFTQSLALLSNYQLQMKYKELKDCNTYSTWTYTPFSF